MYSRILLSAAIALACFAGTGEAQFAAIDEVANPASGAWPAFLQSLLIIVREGFEAILVLGAVVAFLIKTGNRRHLGSIWIGAALGIVASAVTAVMLRTVLSAMPASREIIEGITMLIAVVVLFSVSYWLISRVEAAKWQRFIKQKVNSALDHGGGQALGLVAFLAVYREGAETALFYQALFADGTNVALPIALGIIVGALVLAVVFTFFYRFGVRIPLRPFFAATSVVIYYMAFVFMGKGVHELQEGGVLPLTSLSGFPRVPAMGIYPTMETVTAQLLLVALFVFALIKTFGPSHAMAPAGPRTAHPAADTPVRIPITHDLPAPLAARGEIREPAPLVTGGDGTAPSSRRGDAS